MLVNKRRVKLSRRGAFLTLTGIVYVLIGYSLLNIDPFFKPILHQQLRFALDVAPIEFYGWCWITCGAGAIVGGLWYRLDHIGYPLATFMPLFWSIAYWVAWFDDSIPRAWVGGTTYTFFGLAVLLVSGIVDPREVLARMEKRR